MPHAKRPAPHEVPPARRKGALAVAFFSLAALALLYRYPPASTPIYPPCPIHALTGLLCPGCGATRSLAALLHGHLQQAFHLNALFVILLPLVLTYAACAYTQQRWPRVPTPGMTALYAAAIIFTILRNTVV
ncbi:DUF2752 domain-containing protein [Granulicella sp. WH15]|uniref:DUF2752 domain-containing protein n=1 Tax=Granulicella sp. WH15 TaxID=2602070 RepID=UPI0013A5A7DB|nr:DUF2752 domain-containing protein [Granulicella sp. WH15]